MAQADEELREPTVFEQRSSITHAFHASSAQPPIPMNMHERNRLRAAVIRARQVFPGAVGRLVAEELNAWEQFGFRFGHKRLIEGVVDEVLTAPLPSKGDNS